MQLYYQKSTPKEQVAGFGARVLAFCVDLMLLLLVIGLIEYYTVSSDEKAWLLKGERILHFLLGWLYFAGTESSGKQASIGKHLLGMRVVSLDGRRISFRAATIRYVLKPVSLFVLLMQALSKTSAPSKPLQFFHDKIAGTQVLQD